MKGKFRKRSSAVWCPKPKEKIDWSKCTIEQKNKSLSLSWKDSLEFDKTLPKKKCKVTGWTNIIACESCKYLEEFHLDNEGVFCLYGVDTIE